MKKRIRYIGNEFKYTADYWGHTNSEQLRLRYGDSKIDVVSFQDDGNGIDIIMGSGKAFRLNYGDWGDLYYAMKAYQQRKDVRCHIIEDVEPMHTTVKRKKRVKK